MFGTVRIARKYARRAPIRWHFEALERRDLLTAARFAVVGDFGSDSVNEAAVAQMVENWTPEFVVTTGDNNYPRGEAATIDETIGKYYHDFIGNYVGSYGAGSETNRFFPVLGNHDWMTTVGGSPKPYLDYFTLPGNERYYDFQSGPVHFFMLDSVTYEPDGATVGSPQAMWLQAGLAASTAPWNVVVAHNAPFSSGDVHGSSARMQWPFAAWGADLILSGHEHTYERLTVDGATYIVNGLGGMSRYNFAAIESGSTARYREDYGAMLVEADDAQLTVSFRTVDPQDQIVDMFQLRNDAVSLQSLVPFGAGWQFWDQGTLPAPDWTDANFDDSAWSAGPAQLGYGEGNEATTVDFGGNPAEKLIATYFRHEFRVDDPAAFASLQLDLLRDDGSVVYLNGQEFWRTNMPGGSIAPGTLATHAIDVGAEGSIYRRVFDANLLVPGVNVLAVETHQNSQSSSDLSFDLALAAIGSASLRVDAGPDQTVDEGEAVNISATFTDAGAGDTHTATIDWGDGSPVQTIDPASSPIAVSHAYADNGSYTVTITVSDDDGGSNSDMLTVDVANLPPLVDAGPDQTTDEGEAVNISATFTDAGAGDTHTATIDWGDNSPVQMIDPASSPIAVSHTYAADGSYTVTITASDDDGGSNSDTLTVDVAKLPPFSADLNGDGMVGLVDLAILQSHLGETPNATASMGDLNGDGSVDRTDAALLALEYGRNVALPAIAMPSANALIASARARRRLVSEAATTQSETTSTRIRLRASRRPNPRLIHVITSAE